VFVGSLVAGITTAGGSRRARPWRHRPHEIRRPHRHGGGGAV